MTRNWLGMQQGNSAKTLVETWPPLIRDMQKVWQKIFSFSCLCLCTSNTHMQFILTLLLYFCANNTLWPYQLLVFLLSKMAENPTSDIWIGLRSVDGYEFHWTDGQPRKYIRNVLEVSVCQLPHLNCTMFIFLLLYPIYPFIFVHFCVYIFFFYHSIFYHLSIHQPICQLAYMSVCLSCHIIRILFLVNMVEILEWLNQSNSLFLYFRTLKKRGIHIIFGKVRR